MDKAKVRFLLLVLRRCTDERVLVDSEIRVHGVPLVGFAQLHRPTRYRATTHLLLVSNW